MNLQDVDVNVPFDFSILNKIPMSLKLDVGASAYWSEIMTVQTLDNLLMQGKIGIVDYLERIPEGYVGKKQELIQKMKSQEAAAVQQAAAMQNTPLISEDSMNGEIPVQGGKGYGKLQRALNETGVA